MLPSMISRGSKNGVRLQEMNLINGKKYKDSMNGMILCLLCRGNGYGSEDQIWSAALYLRVRDHLTNNSCNH